MLSWPYISIGSAFLCVYCLPMSVFGVHTNTHRADPVLTHTAWDFRDAGNTGFDPLITKRLAGDASQQLTLHQLRQDVISRSCHVWCHYIHILCKASRLLLFMSRHAAMIPQPQRKPSPGLLWVLEHGVPQSAWRGRLFLWSSITTSTTNNMLALEDIQLHDEVADRNPFSLSPNPDMFSVDTF